MHPQHELRQLLEEIYSPDRVQKILDRTESAWESMGVHTTLQDLGADKSLGREIALELSELQSEGNKSPYLIIQGWIHGRGVSYTVSLTPGRYSVGRHHVNHICLWGDRTLSRMHCVITVHADGHITIRDLVSSNGTFVNTGRLSQSEQELCRDDVIRVGRHVLTLL